MREFTLTHDEAMGLLARAVSLKYDITENTFTTLTKIDNGLPESKVKSIFIQFYDRAPDKLYFVHCDTCHECAEMPGDGVPEEFNAAHLGHALRVASIP